MIVVILSNVTGSYDIGRFFESRDNFKVLITEKRGVRLHLANIKSIIMAEKVVTEWQNGFGNSFFYQLLHLLLALKRRDFFRLYTAIALLFSKRVYVVPHGVNFYGTDSYEKAPRPIWSSCGCFWKYGVSNRTQIWEAINRGVPIDRIFLSTLLFDFNQDMISPDLGARCVVHLPKIRRIDRLKLNQFLLNLTARENESIIFLRHPIDDEGSVREMVSSVCKVPFDVLRFSETGIGQSDRHIDLGTSSILRVFFLLPIVFRFNVTLFEVLELDDVFGREADYSGLRAARTATVVERVSDDQRRTLQQILSE